MPARASPAVTEQIVNVAVALADAEGLDAVSIRRVAAEAGMSSMNLYSYVASKQDLLERMAERAVGELLLHEPVPSGWRQALEAIATRAHQVFTRHPWVVEISRGRRDLGRNGLRHAEQLLTAIAPLGLESADRWHVLFLIEDLTVGHGLRVAYAPAAPPGRYPAFDPADYPHLTRALQSPVPRRDDHTFRSELATLLDGIEQRYGHGPTSATPTG